jgi:Skp family chaperone for outer membrane proteins
MRVGPIKFYWDDTPDTRIENYTGLDDDGLAAVLQEEGDFEILEHEEQFDVTEDGETDRTHDIKINRTVRSGRIRIESIPPEEFLVDGDATCIEDARFLCHRTTRTRSQLIEEGYPIKKVEELPTYHDNWDSEEDLSRQDEFTTSRWNQSAQADWSMEQIQVYECYVQVDRDGDGIAEWTRVIMAGGMSSDHIMDVEEWGDPIPFAMLIPARIPHRWQGRSIADQTMDIQQIKTVLLRSTLDNIYENNNRQRVVAENQIVNMDEVVNPQFGGIIRVRSGVDVNTAVRWDDPKFIGPDTFNMLGYMDEMVEKRTGISRATMALDPQALQNQTATAAQLGQDSRYSKIELVARNFAEDRDGLKRLFSGLLNLVVTHQDRSEIIRLRDQFVEMDPRSWNSDMDVSVNIGLGAGSRDRDLAMLVQILGIQRDAMEQFGPMNPFVTIEHIWNTLDKMIAAGGMKNTEQFFAPITQEDAAQYAQQMMQQQQQSDPKAEAAQAKAQADIQLAQMKAQAELQFKQQEMQAELAFKRQEMEAKLDLEREMMMLKHEARMEELRVEAELKRIKLENEMPSTSPVNVRRPE